MQEDNNDLNAGAATQGSSDSSDLGSQNANPSVSSGTSENQNGNQTAPRNDEVSKYREEVRRLNQALVEAKRGSRSNQQDQNGANPFETPEGQYGIAIQLATADLRGRMEDVFSLYPEIPADEIARIRKNPWAYSTHNSFVKGDWESAALEIEEVLAKRADEISASNKPASTPTPADINANPAQGNSNDPNQAQEEDLWSMPMDELEKRKDKAVAKVSQNK